MSKITLNQFNSFKLTYFIILFFLGFQSKAQTCTPITNNSIEFEVPFPFYCQSTQHTAIFKGTIPIGGNSTSEYNYQYQSSIDGVTFYNTLGKTLNYTPALQTTTTYWRRIVSAPGCTETSISNVLVIKLGKTTEPAIKIISQPTCAVPIGTFIITNYEDIYTYTIVPSNGVIQDGNTIKAPPGKYDISLNGGGICSPTPVHIVFNDVPTSKPADIITNKTICLGESYTWPANGLQYTTSQNGIKILKDECTGDQILNLNIVNPDIVNVETFGVNICKGGSGSLRVTPNPPAPVTTFDGHWNPATDPKAAIPYSVSITEPLENSTICKFNESVISNYTATNFSVSLSGIYEFKMTDTDLYDGISYIYSGNFTPGNCSEGGTWIIGDDDDADSGFEKEPRMKTYLQAGVRYTLISTLWARTSLTYTGDYTWTVTPPEGGQFILNELNYWYASESAEVPIGWGTSFNPVGVSGSGLLNTNTPGTTTYYVTNGELCYSRRTAVDFTITDGPTAGAASSSPTLCVNTPLSNITHTTTGATNIGAISGLPAGVTATWASNTITISGTPTSTGIYSYKIALTGSGCEASFATGKIMVNPKPADVVTNKDICFGATYTWSLNNTTYDTTGIYRIPNDGCNADQVLNLTVGTKPTDDVTNKNICFGETYTWPLNNTPYNIAGIYRISNNGCIADQVLNLTVRTKPTDDVTNKNICFGESYTWPINNTPYDTAGIYRISNNGCTADQVLNLTVDTKPSDDVTNKNICFGETYTWPLNNTPYNTAGIYRIPNNGCTADQVLNLTVGTKPADDVTTKKICFGETYTWPLNNTPYNTAGIYRISNNGCIADQVLNLTVGTKPTDDVTNKDICFGDTYTWSLNNTSYDTAGIYRISNNGCTADQVLNLNVDEKPLDEVTTANICFGETYIWRVNGLEYNTTQNGLRKINNGCTADQVLNLSVGEKPADEVTTANICIGETYIWPVNGLEYNTTQNGLRKINNGCTADQVLNLNVDEKPLDEVTTANICFGETYIWSVNGLEYNTTQNGLRKINNGCTADQVLNLNVVEKPADEITTANICFGETYIWPVNGLEYKTTQNEVRKINNRCNADQVLNLNVNEKPADEITTANICFGDTYIWPVNGLEYNTTQNEIRKNNTECNADQVLNLTVARPLNANLIANSILPELCNGDKNASFKIEITGGSMPYNVALDNINDIYEEITGNEDSFINLSGGLHNVYIKDAQGCTTELEVTIPNAITMNPIANITYSCANNDSANAVTITVDSNILNLAEIEYTLDGNPNDYQTTNVFRNLIPGEHTVTARHLNGCEQTTLPFIIGEFEPLTLTLTDGELNEIVANADGGAKNYQYKLDDEYYGTVNKFIISKSGTYSITVTDKNGCSVTVSQYFTFIDICIPNYFTPNGDGINDEWGPDCTINYKNLTYSVFDRYGRILAKYGFGQKWDGKYNGAELPAGDYWYTLKLNDPKDNREFVGHFTLYR
jgi:gliding motility-associated-like protein